MRNADETLSRPWAPGGSPFARIKARGTALTMALMVWICVMVPLLAIGLLTWGWGALTGAGAGLLAISIIVCLKLCAPVAMDGDHGKGDAR